MTRHRRFWLLTTAAALTLSGGLAGCKDDAGDELRHEADEIGDKLHDAADEAGDKLEKAGEKVKDAVD